MLVGGDQDAGLQVNHPSISPQHAQLAIQGDRAVLTDLGSQNGTYVNGQPVSPGSPQVLNEGDIVFFGDSPIELELLRVAPVTVEKTAIDLELKQGQTYTIGRNPNCQLRITHPTVSNFHAQIEQRGGDWMVMDMDSTNGTFVDGRRLAGRAAPSARVSDSGRAFDNYIPV